MFAKAASQIEAERLCEKVKSAEVHTYAGWKASGRQVKRGEKAKSFRVQSGVYRAGIDPISGEDRYEPKMVTVFAFTKDQTY